MGTAVALASKKSTALSVIDPRNLNYDLAQAWAEKEAAGRRVFAGEQIKFNGQEGTWKQGFGDKAKEYKDGHEIVVNYPHTVTAWQEWAGDAPNYPYIHQIFVAGSLPPRSELGLMDKTQWKDGYNEGEKADPFKRVSVLFCRDKKGDNLFHILADTITGTNAVAHFIQDAIEEGRRKGGMLPVVALSAEKKKKDKKSFYVPVLEIVEWVKSISIDNPDGGMLDAVAEVAEDDDQGEVKSSSRNSRKPSREEEDEKDEADEGEEDADPRTTRRRARDEVKDEDEDRPTRRRASDDNDDEDASPRRRRRLN